MKKSLLFLLSICVLYFLDGCGSGGASPTPSPTATHFSVTAASSTQTAGTTFNITVIAEVQLVSCDPNDPDPEVVWHIKEYGGGVLISDPIVSGRTFIPKDQLDEYEDLEFVSGEQGS
jgi:hypothetical protein